MARNAQTRVAVAANSTKVEDAKAKTVDADMFEEIMKRYADAQDSLLKFFKAPSWKRTLVAFITTVVVGYGIGWIAGNILNWMVAGAVAMAVPTFITVIVYVLGVIAAIYYGGKFAARIGGSVLTGEADARAVAAYDATKNMFKKLNPFGKREAVAAA